VLLSNSQARLFWVTANTAEGLDYFLEVVQALAWQSRFRSLRPPGYSRDLKCLILSKLRGILNALFNVAQTDLAGQQHDVAVSKGKQMARTFTGGPTIVRHHTVKSGAFCGTIHKDCRYLASAEIFEDRRDVWAWNDD
jgi:hypothetical protein